MQFFDVQITTDMGEVVVVQVAAGDRQEAEMTAISMVESGHAGNGTECCGLFCDVAFVYFFAISAYINAKHIS